MRGIVKKKEPVRQLRVAQDIKGIISNILYTERPYDEELGDFIVSVTAVEVSSSLQDAKIFVIPMDKSKSDKIMDYLKRNTTFFKTLLGKRLQLRYVPNIKFIFDESYDYADHMNIVFDKIKN